MNRVLSAAALLSMCLIAVQPIYIHGQGTTGTIRGRVTEAATGQPLPATSLTLLAADGITAAYEASPNEQGDFYILNVPPGRYSLQAVLRGFRTTDVMDLVVRIGVTTFQDFQLESTVLDVGETVTVMAERDVIRRNATAAHVSYTFDELNLLPVRTVADVLALQTSTLVVDDFVRDAAGLYDRGLTPMVYTRGGRHGEVAFMIDGMKLTERVFGGAATLLDLSSISEMVIMAGGMSAEYGNAMSGIVNMVTRDGGAALTGSVELLSSELGNAADRADDMTSLGGFLGGPVPSVPWLTFMASGSATTSRDYVILKDKKVFDFKADPLNPNWKPDPNIDYRRVPRNPDGTYDWTAFDPDAHDIYYQTDMSGNSWNRLWGGDVYSGWLGYGFDDRWDGLLNLGHRFASNLRLTASYLRDGRWSVPYTDEWRHAMLWGMPEWLQYYYLWGYPDYRSGLDGKAYLREPYYIDPVLEDPDTSLPYNPRNDQSWRILESGRTDFHNEKNLLFLNNMRLAFTATHQPSPRLFYSLRGSYFRYDRSMRARRWVNRDGWTGRLEHVYRGIENDPSDPNYGNPLPPWWMFGDPMQQVMLRWQPGWYGYDEGDPAARRYAYRSWSDTGAGISCEGSDRYLTDQIDVTRTLRWDVTAQVSAYHQVKAGVLYDALTLDMAELCMPWSVAPACWSYRYSPWELGFYVQQRLDYRALTVDAGLRYEAANPGAIPYWLDPRDPFDRQGNLVPEPYDPAFAPLKSARTRSHLAHRLGISVPLTERSAFYANYGQFCQKPSYRYIYQPGYILSSGSLVGNPNLRSERTVSMELGCKHQMTDLDVVELTVWWKEQSELVGSERIQVWLEDVEDPLEYSVLVNDDYANASGLDLTLRRRHADFWSAWVKYSFMGTATNRDQGLEGYCSGTGGLLAQQSKVPRVVSWDQPHRFTGSLVLRIPQGAGLEIRGTRPLEELTASIVIRVEAGLPYTPTDAAGNSLEDLSGRKPWNYQCDLQLSRDVRVLNRRTTVFADVRNLFDRRNAIMVYSRTGKPDDPGPSVTGYSDHYDNFQYYATPRRISVGLRIFF